jgi:uncharacterized protein
MTDGPTPVQPRERIAALDILRAFALLGILVMNMPSFFSTFWSTEMPEARWPAWYDRSAIWVMGCFFSGKFNSLFSFLFGIGFTIQLERLFARSPHPVAIYLRRLGVLLLFGIMHALFLWTGDVLHMYAILGALLVLMRRLPDKAIGGIIVLGLLFPTIMSTWFLFYYGAKQEQEDRSTVARMEQMTRQGYGSGTWMEATRTRAAEMKEIYSDPRSLSFLPSLFLTILLGFYTGRKRLIQESRERLAFVRKVQWWSFGLGIACAVLFSALRPLIVPFKPSVINVIVSTAYSWQRPALMLFYASTIVVLTYSPRWGRYLAALAPAGRMPLTNYLMQSVICTTIFYGYGFGLFEKIGPAVGFGLSFVIYGIQIVYSRWWLSNFQFGPAEWLWRYLTYGIALPMRIRPAADTTDAAAA